MTQILCSYLAAIDVQRGWLKFDNACQLITQLKSNENMLGPTWSNPLFLVKSSVECQCALLAMASSWHNTFKLVVCVLNQYWRSHQCSRYKENARVTIYKVADNKNEQFQTKLE